MQDDVVVHVCVTCLSIRADGANTDHGRAGEAARLIDHLSTQLPPEISVRPVECLSVCKRAVTLAIMGPGRWTYVLADLHGDDDAPALAEGIRLYAKAPDGIVPWRDRPEVMKRRVVARIPALNVMTAVAAK